MPSFGSEDENIVIAPVANGIVTTANNTPKKDLKNFLFETLFEVISTHTEDLKRSDN
jgi:hypothetical protein